MRTVRDEAIMSEEGECATEDNMSGSEIVLKTGDSNRTGEASIQRERDEKGKEDKVRFVKEERRKSQQWRVHEGVFTRQKHKLLGCCSCCRGRCCWRSWPQ